VAEPIHSVLSFLTTHREPEREGRTYAHLTRDPDLAAKSGCLGAKIKGRLLSCTDLDLPVPNADVKAWLREGRWPLEDSAVVEGKSRSVPRATNCHIVELPVGEWAPEMCAAVRERMDAVAPSDEHDWYTSNIHSLRY
jgi:hypothetical protein